jgi:hypothetical protein
MAFELVPHYAPIRQCLPGFEQKKAVRISGFLADGKRAHAPSIQTEVFQGARILLMSLLV